MSELDAHLDSLARRSRIFALISGFGAVVVFGTLGVGVWRLARVQKEIDAKQQLVTTLDTKAVDLDAKLTDTRHSVSVLDGKKKELEDQIAKLQQQRDEALQSKKEIVDTVQAAIDAHSSLTNVSEDLKEASGDDDASDQARELWREGQAALLHKQEDVAEQKFRASIAANPKYGPPYNSLGRMKVDNAARRDGSYDMAQVEEGVKLYRQGLDAWPTYVAALQNLALVELKIRNDRRAAAGYAKKILELRPNDRRAKAILAEAKGRGGD